MYSIYSKLIHSISALMIFSLLILGYIMVDLDYYSPWYQTLPNWHYIMGLVFVGVLLARILNTFFIDRSDKAVELPAKIGHWLMYVFMVGCVVTGFTLASDDLYFFPSMYDVFNVDKELWHLGHKIFTYGLLLLIAGHVGMALLHQFVLKQPILHKMFH